MRHGMAFSNRLAFSEALPRNSESRALAIALRMIKKHDQHIESMTSFGRVPVRRWHDLSHGRFRPLRKPVNQLDVIAEWCGRAQDDAGHWHRPEHFAKIGGSW
ncbi:hypothetical protein [Bradyrhizobium elkanii]|uniref:Mom family adenine methylcarbamoylation protein n=1 Tax=Bradyrhizobium elkanii TaxID=29448 RepID=UPI002226FF96|nr:hypothetical protein [Bradyrhizobium elkanii]MCW2130748.1 hypothetical protein [Bradyrhizobium elkanii]MCW2175904.1 hypothetical protein [Bradyrhizobium elkanii]